VRGRGEGTGGVAEKRGDVGTEHIRRGRAGCGSVLKAQPGGVGRPWAPAPAACSALAAVVVNEKNSRYRRRFAARRP